MCSPFFKHHFLFIQLSEVINQMCQSIPLLNFSLHHLCQSIIRLKGLILVLTPGCRSWNARPVIATSSRHDLLPICWTMDLCTKTLHGLSIVAGLLNNQYSTVVCFMKWRILVTDLPRILFCLMKVVHVKGQSAVTVKLASDDISPISHAIKTL